MPVPADERRGLLVDSMADDSSSAPRGIETDQALEELRDWSSGAPSPERTSSTWPPRTYSSGSKAARSRR
jgi:hypothetical protein